MDANAKRNRQAAFSPSPVDQEPRRSSRSTRFTGRFANESKKGGFKRNSKAFKDPEDSFKLLTPLLEKRDQVYLKKARMNFKRKTMSDKITEGMKKRAKSLKPHEQTAESQRVLKYPDASLTMLGVERNHINANSQVATQITAFTSFYLDSGSKTRKKVITEYQQFAQSHGLSKQSAEELGTDFFKQTSMIENEKDTIRKQRVTESMLTSHTTLIADQSENLRFGRSQHLPKPDLKIPILNLSNLGSNQDVGSNWDGNRTPNGSLTPRSQMIHDGIQHAEKEGIFPPGMANASTTRPIRKSDNTAFGSLLQIGKKK